MMSKNKNSNGSYNWFLMIQKEILKEVNRFSCAKLFIEKIEFIYSNTFSCQYKNSRNIINIDLSLDKKEIIKSLVHELRHAQQNIIFYEYYSNEKHIKDIHNDVESWKLIFEGKQKYDYKNCSLEDDAYAYIFFFFNYYKKYNIKLSEANINDSKTKSIYFEMQNNCTNFK